MAVTASIMPVMTSSTKANGSSTQLKMYVGLILSHALYYMIYFVILYIHVKIIEFKKFNGSNNILAAKRTEPSKLKMQ